MRGKRPELSERFFTALCSLFTDVMCGSAYLFFKYACQGTTENDEAIRRNLRHGFVIASNHVSYLDWLVLYAYFHARHGIRVLFIAKDKLFRHPLWKYVVRGARCVRVSDCGTKILSHRDYRRLTEAKYVCIFPEATRSATGVTLPPHGGAIKIAARNGLPLIPLRLKGFYEAWPRGKTLPRPAPCSIIMGRECRFDPALVKPADEASLSRCMLTILNTLGPADLATEATTPVFTGSAPYAVPGPLRAYRAEGR
jgi:1-acyl-sn-glycerol-3-phosphate acyltransferase